MILRRFLATALIKNENIKAKEVMVVSEASGILGKYALQDALKLFDRTMNDLVLVQEKATPPVCKIISKKALYESKLRKEQKPKSKEKEMFFGTSVTQHDFEIKLNRIEKFIEKGYSTKVVIEPKGHGSFTANSKESLQKKIMDHFGKKITVNNQSSEGNNLVFSILPSK